MEGMWFPYPTEKMTQTRSFLTPDVAKVGSIGWLLLLLDWSRTEVPLTTSGELT